VSVFTSLLNNTFAVSRMVRAADGQGGFTVAYEAVGSVAGRIRPTSSQERTVALSEERQISHVLYTAADEDVARGDLVVCGDLTVEVLGIREPSLAGEHWEIDCLERTNETAEELGS